MRPIFQCCTALKFLKSNEDSSLETLAWNIYKKKTQWSYVTAFAKLLKPICQVRIGNIADFSIDFVRRKQYSDPLVCRLTFFLNYSSLKFRFSIVLYSRWLWQKLITFFRRTNEVNSLSILFSEIIADYSCFSLVICRKSNDTLPLLDGESEWFKSQ